MSRHLQAAPWGSQKTMSFLLATVFTVAPHGADAQRLREYNLWVCPHCEKGVKHSDVADLSCEETAADAGGADWPSVKQTLYKFLQSFRLRPEQRDVEQLRPLMSLITAPTSGECYLGTMALGFFSFHFMDTKERMNFIKDTVFGGVPFQRAVPLSYWDVYASGWPIFGLLAAAAGTVQHDAVHAPKDGSSWKGMTGIDLHPTGCCDFLDRATDMDQDFLRLLGATVGDYDWVDGTAPALPQTVALRYLAETAHINCSWGRATAYFALAETLLVAPGGASSSSLQWNSTRAFMKLGEHNLDNCRTNTTMYHQMLSAWPFWQLLGRLEQRRLHIDVDAIPAPGGGFTTSLAGVSPPLPQDALSLKWRHLSQSRGLTTPTTPAKAAAAASATVWDDRMSRPVSAAPCLEATPGLAHVAMSADTAQIDGLIVALNSGVINAGANSSRLCLHAFALPHQRQFVVDALACAFGANMTAFAPASANPDGNKAPPVAFLLHGSARLLVHALEPARVWNYIGMPGAARTSGVSTSSSKDAPDAVELGDVGTREALRSDTGNLGAVHNFARFVLHELLPALPRVVYLDVDIVVRGDLCELYDTDLLASSGSGIETGATVAAVRRTHQSINVYVDVLQPAMPSWLPSEAPSFNAGVMVIDLVRWRVRHCTRLVAEWIAANKDRRLWMGGSQPPLLVLFHDEVAPLHWGWNIDGLGHRLNYPKDVLREARLLHWTGPLKPWRHHGVNRHLWEPYALEYCPQYSKREHTTTCRPDSWFC